MNRFQKKCLVVSAAMHALLFLVLIVGTAFRAEKKPEEPPHLIQIIPANAIITGGKTQGGGSPVPAAPVQAPPLAPPTAVKPTEVKPIEPEPQPTKPVEKPVEPAKPVPEPKHEEVSELPVPHPKKTKPLPKQVESSEPKSKVTPKPRDVPDISKPTVRNAVDKKAAAEAARLSDQKADQKARDQRLAAVNNSLTKLGQNLSSLSTGIESLGGGGGAAEINYRDLVFSKYDAAWTAPTDIDDAEANTKVKVVIARSGKVISADVIKGSGNSVLDKSVHRAIDSLNFIGPFPEGSKDLQRTFIINFNLKAKRGLG